MRDDRIDDDLQENGKYRRDIGFFILAFWGSAIAFGYGTLLGYNAEKDGKPHYDLIKLISYTDLGGLAIAGCTLYGGASLNAVSNPEPKSRLERITVKMQASIAKKTNQMTGKVGVAVSGATIGGIATTTLGYVGYLTGQVAARIL
ncbi:MAG: hypothetical protein V1702_06555 [Candidatus Woesearchaeota archaeon]